MALLVGQRPRRKQSGRLETSPVNARELTGVSTEIAEVRV